MTSNEIDVSKVLARFSMNIPRLGALVFTLGTNQVRIVGCPPGSTVRVVRSYNTPTRVHQWNRLADVEADKEGVAVVRVPMRNPRARDVALEIEIYELGKTAPHVIETESVEFRLESFAKAILDAFGDRSLEETEHVSIVPHLEFQITKVMDRPQGVEVDDSQYLMERAMWALLTACVRAQGSTLLEHLVNQEMAHLAEFYTSIVRRGEEEAAKSKTLEALMYGKRMLVANGYLEADKSCLRFTAKCDTLLEADWSLVTAGTLEY